MFKTLKQHLSEQGNANVLVATQTEPVEDEEVETEEEPQEEAPSAVALALALATTIDIDEERRTLLQNRDAFLATRSKGLTAFEDEIKSKIVQERSEIAVELKRIEFHSKMVGFKSLPLDVLSWRHKEALTSTYPDFGNGWGSGKPTTIRLQPPKLALFLKGPKVVLAINNVRAPDVTPYPREIQAMYRDIWDEMFQHNQINPILRTDFQGVIPEEVREIISSPPKKELRWDSEPMLLAEAPLESWQLGIDPAPRGLYDPLVVRLGGGRLWILGQFDPTSMEQYLLDEFSQ